MDKAAVVILNWNGEKFLRKYLPALVANTTLSGVSIIVADNCSSDNSIVFLQGK